MKLILALICLTLSFTQVTAQASLGTSDMNAFAVTAAEVKQDLPGWAGESTGNVIRLNNGCSIRKINSLIARGARFDLTTNTFSIYGSYNVTPKQDGSGAITTFDQSVSTTVRGYPFILSCSNATPISMAEFQGRFEKYVSLMVRALAPPPAAAAGIGGLPLVGFRCSGKSNSVNYFVSPDFSSNSVIDVSTTPSSAAVRKSNILNALELNGEFVITARESSAPAPAGTANADMILHINKGGIGSSIELSSQLNSATGKDIVSLACGYSVALY